MVISAVKIDGLNEFGKALRAIDRGLAKALRLVLNEGADDVAGEARRKVPERRGTAAKTVRAASTTKLSRVSGGGKRAPYYPWLDFGGRVGRNRSVSRPVRKSGRYIFVVYGKKRDSGEFTEKLDRLLKALARRAGIDLEPGD